MLIHTQKTSSKNFFFIVFFLILIVVSSFIIYYHFYLGQNATEAENEITGQMLPPEAAAAGSNVVPVSGNNVVVSDNQAEQWQFLQSGFWQNFKEVKLEPVKQKQGRVDIFTPKF